MKLMAAGPRKTEKSGHRLAAENIPFPRRWYGGIISASLDVIRELSVEHSVVANAQVVSTYDLVHGEDVLAHITLKQGAAIASGTEPIRLAGERVGCKAPEEIVVLDEMPFTVIGKVDRTSLKHLAGEGKTVAGL